jgi:hypothetical protein
MKSQPSRTSAAVYRCATTTVHGRCERPAVIAKDRLEEHVLRVFVEEADIYLRGTSGEGDATRRGLLEEATAAERRYRTALTNVDLRAKIGDVDHDELIASLHDAWQEKQRALREASEGSALSAVLPTDISVAGLVEQLYAEGQNEKLRSLLEAGIQAVFVRPARSRARNLPVEDRVKIVWHETENVALPRRGRRFDPRPYVW